MLWLCAVAFKKASKVIPVMGLSDRFNAKTEKQLYNDFQALHEKHEMLSLRLGELESKTQTATQWLTQMENDIIHGYHALSSALRAQDADTVIRCLEPPAAAAIIHLPAPVDSLSATTFREWAETTFKDKSDDKTRVMAAFELLPPEPLPRAVLSSAAAAIATGESESAPSDVTEKYGLWSRLTGTAEKELLESISQKERAILSLQTRVPYYMDSFMEWAEAAVAPAPGTPLYDTPDLKAWNELQNRYKDPLYTMQQAESDFLAATDQRVLTFGAMALDYDRFATALESNDARKAVAALDEYSTAPHFGKMAGWLIKEHDKASLAHFALDEFESRQDQAQVFIRATDAEKRIAFLKDGQDTRDTLFNAVYTEILDRSNPLPLSVLGKTLDYINSEKNGGELIARTVFAATGDSKEVRNVYFKSAVEAYGNNPEKLSAVLSMLIGGTEKDGELTTGYARMIKALADNDGAELAQTLTHYGPKNLKKIIEFATFIDPAFDLTARIMTRFKNDAHMTPSLDAVLDAGESFLPRMPAGAGLRLAVECALDAAHPLPVATLEKIIRDYTVTRKTDMFSALTEHSADSYPLDRALALGRDRTDDAQEAVLAALLRPLGDNTLRAYALYHTAENSPDVTRRDALDAMGDALAGHYLRLATQDGESLINPGQMIAVWRDKELKLRSSGQRDQGLGHDDTAIAAIVTALSHRPWLLRTDTEILNPANIDAIYMSQDQKAYYIASDIATKYHDDPASAQSLIADIHARHPQFIKADNILLNPTRIDHLSYDPDEQSVSYSGIRVPLLNDPDAGIDLLRALARDPNYLVIGNHALNLAQVTSLWPGANDAEIAFSAKGCIHDSNFDPAYQKDTGSGIPMDGGGAEEAINAATHLENFVSIGAVRVNLAQVFCLRYDADDGILTWSTSASDADGEAAACTSREAKNAFRKAAEQGHRFWIDPAKMLAINLALIDGIALHEQDKAAEFISGGESLRVENADQAEIMKLALMLENGATLIERPGHRGVGTGINAAIINLSRTASLRTISDKSLEIMAGGAVVTLNLNDLDSKQALDRIEQDMRDKTLPKAQSDIAQRMIRRMTQPQATAAPAQEGFPHALALAPEDFLLALRKANARETALPATPARPKPGGPKTP